jgi:hypothetical protein
MLGSMERLELIDQLNFKAGQVEIARKEYEEIRAVYTKAQEDLKLLDDLKNKVHGRWDHLHYEYRKLCEKLVGE